MIKYKYDNMLELTPHCEIKSFFRMSSDLMLDALSSSLLLCLTFLVVNISKSKDYAKLDEDLLKEVNLV